MMSAISNDQNDDTGREERDFDEVHGDSLGRVSRAARRRRFGWNAGPHPGTAAGAGLMQVTCPLQSLCANDALTGLESHRGRVQHLAGRRDTRRMRAASGLTQSDMRPNA